MSWVWMVPLLPPLPLDCASTNSAPWPLHLPPEVQGPWGPLFPSPKAGLCSSVQAPGLVVPPPFTPDPAPCIQPYP